MSAAKRRSTSSAMPVVGLVLMLLLALPGPIVSQQSPTYTGRDLVLIVDLSASMVGRGGGQNIFPRVQDTTKQLVRELALGDTVTLVTFHDTVTELPTITLQSETERSRILSLIDGLRAIGDWTYTSQALEIGLGEAERLDDTFPQHQKVVLILTDGLNNPPPSAPRSGPTMEQIARRFAGKPWYVYQVQLGLRVDPQLQAATAVFEHGETIHDPRATRLPKLPRLIASRPAPPAQIVVKWQASPTSLEIRLSDHGVSGSASTELEFPSELPVGYLRLSVRGDGITPGLRITNDLRPEQSGRASVQLSATAEEGVPNGSYVGALRVELEPVAQSKFSAEPFDIPFAVQMAAPTIWKLYGPLVSFAIVLLAAVGFAAGRWWPRRLFGSLEGWQSDGGGARVKVDLSTLGTKATIGGTENPWKEVKSPVGQLRVNRHEGRYQVIVEPASSATLRYQKQLAPYLVLFDRDEFQLGDHTFRYACADGRVPVREKGRKETSGVG